MFAQYFFQVGILQVMDHNLGEVVLRSFRSSRLEARIPPLMVRTYRFGSAFWRHLWWSDDK
jgi:hypothetical protein